MSDDEKKLEVTAKKIEADEIRAKAKKVLSFIKEGDEIGMVILAAFVDEWRHCMSLDKTNGLSTMAFDNNARRMRVFLELDKATKEVQEMREEPDEKTDGPAGPVVFSD